MDWIQIVIYFIFNHQYGKNDYSILILINGYLNFPLSPIEERKSVNYPTLIPDMNSKRKNYFR